MSLKFISLYIPVILKAGSKSYSKFKVGFSLKVWFCEDHLMGILLICFSGTTSYCLGVYLILGLIMFLSFHYLLSCWPTI